MIDAEDSSGGGSGEWNRIFNDAMTTAAAIDRVVHHSIILELSGPSIRNQEAAQRKRGSTSKSSKPKEDK